MNWDPFFKPEIRNRGQKLFQLQAVKASSPSETEISGFVKAYKVTFRSKSISSPQFLVQCSCGKKLCQHAWALMLAAQNKYPDFFINKSDLEMNEQKSAADSKKQDLKERQNLYRKVQYQKQKLRQKQIKLAKEEPLPSYPQDIVDALKYFADNGFVFDNPEDLEQIQSAKKKLARVFHPDRGGHHDEFVLLNQNAEILIDFFSLS